MSNYTVFDTETQEARSVRLFDNGDGTYTMLAGVSIDPGDIAIGAVELKDADSGTRVRIQEASDTASGTTPVLLVQPVDADGNVIDTMATFQAEYTTRLEEASSTVTYVGKALPGTLEASPAWQVTRITQSGGSLSVVYANGSTNFDEAWSDRATLTYN